MNSSHACTNEASSQPCEHDARERKKCKVRTPSRIAGKMQGANTINANNNGPKWQRMNMDYDYVLCVVFCFVASVFLSFV